MKKITAILITFFLVSAITANAWGSGSNRPHHKPPRHSERPGSTGAPLDGGLLTVLGAAGVAYYASRKKKRNPEA